MKIILVRHGQSIANIKDLMSGHYNTPLSKEGVKQVKKLGKRLKNEKIDCIYSSDLHRAHDTAQAVHKYHKHLEHRMTEDLRERDFGLWEGKHVRFHKGRPPKGYESDKKMLVRAKAIIKKLYKEHKGQTIFIAAHGSFNKALLAMFVDDTTYLESLAQENTCVNICRMGPKPEVHLMNCVKHLA